MPYEEYDKLAWGLVKDEIRRLVKPRDPLGLEETLAHIIKPDKLGYYRGQGALSDAGLKRARREILQSTAQRLATFGHSSSRARLEDGGGVMTVDSSFAWDFKELGVTDYQATNKNRHENLLELRHLNFGISKRKMILDMLSCFILVNHHTLYRMIQRGATNREPIALLSDKFDDWSGYAPFTHKALVRASSRIRRWIRNGPNAWPRAAFLPRLDLSSLTLAPARAWNNGNVTG